MLIKKAIYFILLILLLFISPTFGQQETKGKLESFEGSITSGSIRVNYDASGRQTTVVNLELAEYPGIKFIGAPKVIEKCIKEGETFKGIKINFQCKKKDAKSYTIIKCKRLN